MKPVAFWMVSACTSGIMLVLTLIINCKAVLKQGRFRDLVRLSVIDSGEGEKHNQTGFGGP